MIMAMTAGCAICSDSIFKVFNPPAEPGQPAVVVPSNVNAMVTPCGHAYHAYCITRWMMGTQPNSNNCPNCRKLIPRKTCSPLFLDTYDPSLLESSTGNLPGDPTGSCDVENLRLEVEMAMRQCEESEAKYTVLRKELQELTLMRDVLSNENETLLGDLQRERIKSESYVVKYQEAVSYKSYAEQKEREVLKLKDDLKKLNFIRTMLDGVRVETDHDMKDFPVTSGSIRTLLELKHLLMQEVEVSKQRVRNLEIQAESNRKEALSAESKTNQLVKEKEELEYVIESLSSKGSSASAHRKLSTQSFKHQTHNASNKTSGPKNNKPAPYNADKTVEISSDSSEEATDKDVGLLAGIMTTRAATRKVLSLAKPSKPVANHSPLRNHCKSGVPGLRADGSNRAPRDSIYRRTATQARASSKVKPTGGYN